MAEKIEPTKKQETTEPEPVLELQETEEPDEVVAHHCISVLSVGTA